MLDENSVRSYCHDGDTVAVNMLATFCSDICALNTEYGAHNSRRNSAHNERNYSTNHKDNKDHLGEIASFNYIGIRSDVKGLPIV